jgi:hypothetical protein
MVGRLDDWMKVLIVLDVVALRVARAPQLVQVAGHRTRGADDDVARPGQLVDGAQDLRLRGKRSVAEAVKARQLGSASLTPRPPAISYPIVE